MIGLFEKLEYWDLQLAEDENCSSLKKVLNSGKDSGKVSRSGTSSGTGVIEEIKDDDKSCTLMKCNIQGQILMIYS
jgi:hypothetical protein